LQVEILTNEIEYDGRDAWLSITRDITERKRIEDALRESEEKYRTILQNIEEGYFEVDLVGNFTFFNDTLSGFLGYPPDELMGLNYRRYVSKENVKKVFQTFNTVYQTGEPAQAFDWEMIRKDGERRLVESSVSLTHDSTGAPIGFRGIVRDVTGHRQAEIERERLLTILEHRGTQLQTAAEVSRAVGSILDPEALAPQVVDLVRERFNLYYAGLFLVDQTGEWTGEPYKWAVLRAGTGEAGRQMLRQGHKLEIGGTSMIGWCIANKQARITLDVGEDAVRFDNPHLPNTRSELALPLINRGRPIGALTIQSDQEAAFTKEDIAALQTMCN
jgi:PAS domain S-box-containing protein